jgi:hypothetical protein
MRMRAILATIPLRERVRGLDRAAGKAVLLGSQGLRLGWGAANHWKAAGLQAGPQRVDEPSFG